MFHYDISRTVSPNFTSLLILSYQDTRQFKLTCLSTPDCSKSIQPKRRNERQSYRQRLLRLDRPGYRAPGKHYTSQQRHFHTVRLASADTITTQTILQHCQQKDVEILILILDCRQEHVFGACLKKIASCGWTYKCSDSHAGRD